MKNINEISISDVINDSETKEKNLSDIIIIWAKERTLLNRTSFEHYKSEYRKGNLVFWLSERVLHRGDLSRAYKKMYGVDKSITHMDLYNVVQQTNKRIGKDIFVLGSNSYGVTSIGLK